MLIMKFGGSSLGSGSRFLNVAAIIKKYAKLGPIGIVLSASGETTNMLTRLVQAARLGKGTRDIIDSIREHHFALAATFDPHIDTLSMLQLKANTNLRLDKVVGLAEQLSAAPTNAQLSDSLLIQGEKLSVLLMQHLLGGMNVRCQHIDPREHIICRTTDYLNVDLQKSQSLLSNSLNQHTQIFLSEGFYGGDEHGNIRLFGRNGSDLSALIYGVLLVAERVDIWTDVNGVYQADPNLIEDAELVDRIDFQRLLEYARHGAQVIYPPAITLAAQHNLKIQVRSALEPLSLGTMIEKGIENTEKYALIAVLNVSNMSVAPDKTKFHYSVKKEGESTEVLELDTSLITWRHAVPDSAVLVSIHIDDVVNADELLSLFYQSFSTVFATGSAVNKGIFYAIVTREDIVPTKLNHLYRHVKAFIKSNKQLRPSLVYETSDALTSEEII